MIATIILGVVIGVILLAITLIAQSILPCDKCPLRKHCKELEECGHSNLCTHETIYSDYEIK